MLPRIAPPASAIMTPQTPMESGFSMCGFASQNGERKRTIVKRLAGQDSQEHDAFKYRNGRIRQFVVTLQTSAACENGPEHNGDDQNAQGRLSGQKRHQNADVTV